MSSSDIAISARNVSKSYTIAHNQEKHITLAETLLARLKTPFKRTEKETFWALKDIDFDIKKGEVVGIIGRNGAGKSTLLKILSRITEPTKGEIDLYGRVASLLEVGTGFHAELTGRENIFLNGAILGMNKAEIRKQFDAIVDFAGVNQFLDTPVKRYSSGMYVRLAFAVAAHLNPEILVVDEVLAVGDAEFQKKCLGKMKDVASGGRTVLFVSHNMGAVRSLCDRTIVLHGGNVVFDGDIDGGVQSYAGVGVTRNVEIISLISKCHADVQLERITINGQPWHELHMTSDEAELDIRILGQLKTALRVDLEVWLKDGADTPLAFFSSGHAQGVTRMLPAGVFEVRRVLKLPKGINTGEYLLWLSLTHHNVYSWVDIPRAVRLLVEGKPTRTGRPLEYRDGKGFIRLDESPDAEMQLIDKSETIEA